MLSNIFGVCLAIVKKYRQFVLYSLIGISGATLDFLLFVLLYQVFGIDPAIATVISISAGIVNNFFLNAKYNFKLTTHWPKRLLAFYAIGLVGIVVSVFIITLLHNVFGVNAALAKAISIPIIVVLQYSLNRRVSFGSGSEIRFLVKKVLHQWPAIMILFAYISLSLVAIARIPADFTKSYTQGAPDEGIHYRFNVKFIMENQRLPVSGRDDIETYQACRDNQIGLVPCVYSYNIFPAVSYIAAATSASLVSRAGLASPEVGARFAALFFGVVFVCFAYGTALVLTKRRLFAATLTASIVFIPQFIFTTSYTNLDAHSLAISAILGFALIMFMLKPASLTRQAWLCIALFGLLPLAKANYFSLGVGALILIIYAFINSHQNIKHVLRFGVIALASFLVFSAFWYIRNLVLYGDPIGQEYMLHTMAQYHALGNALPLDLSSLNKLFQLDFIGTLFKSFFVTFGLMSFFVEIHKYDALKIMLYACTALFVYIYITGARVKNDGKKIGLAVLVYLLVFIASLALIVYNSLHYDYQPQGRYMFPVLIPTLILVGYAIRKNRAFGAVSFAMLFCTTYIFFEAAGLFIRVYFSL